MNKKYENDVLESAYEIASALHEHGFISKKTMREFDTDCLSPIEKITPDQIKFIREKENISQHVFSVYMNVSKNLISDWERGIKHPGGAALRLLTIVKNKGIKAIA